MSSDDFDGYKTDLSLNITLSDPADFGSYYCISKNEKGLTKAVVEMFGKYLLNTDIFLCTCTKKNLRLYFCYDDSFFDSG